MSPADDRAPRLAPAALFDLDGRVACVTGASAGLGRRAAEVLRAAGARVVGLARRESRLAEWAAAVPERSAVVAADLEHRATLTELKARIDRAFGPPDILVNAAGVNHREPADEVTDAGWDSTLNLNLSAPFFLARACVVDMRARRWGRIINFASLQSYRAFPNGIAYGSSKGGVAQMTRAMAEAWSADGVNANAIGPGFFRTELTEAVFDDPARAERNAAQTCIGRNGELADIDGTVLYLASDASAYVTGQVLMVDGGYTAK